ncbi:hypothetical protein F5Y15DRAFT_373661 [Xylariaceae sp. FL0016]|nr:hypothetical protein F5Y15DRAFT_373661 [Xylariaceae sp. FL0016]
MATSKPPGLSDRSSRNPLTDELARALPKDCAFTVYHLSTTPTVTDALCYPPALKSTSSDPQSKPRPSKPFKTYCEKHFLAISIKQDNEGFDQAKYVLVLGLEVYIYTTAFSTTIFVAKADSTGYLHLLQASKGISPIKEVVTVFLDFLITARRRRSKQLVVSLFARAQDQYLFPGSIKNTGKHVLNDRGLIRWWCRVLNPLLETGGSRSDSGRTHGYLVVPGLDSFETRAYIPRTNDAPQHWTLGHPLEHISPYTKDPATFGDRIPPRCLIPTYPDDPKARYVNELEETTSEKRRLLNGWHSPSTLEQFWELMAFRTECSSGRMTGFIWIVFDPEEKINQSANTQATTMPTPAASFSVPPSIPKASQEEAASPATPTATSKKRSKDAPKSVIRKRRAKKILTGPIIPRKPRVKANRVQFPKQIETPHYYWPEAGRGQVVLDDNGYTRAVELLLHLEFGTLSQAINSTSRWVNEVNMGQDWALQVTGEKVVTAPSTSHEPNTINNLSGMIKRKRPSDSKDGGVGGATTVGVNSLGASLIRKKPKVEAQADL